MRHFTTRIESNISVEKGLARGKRVPRDAGVFKVENQDKQRSAALGLDRFCCNTKAVSRLG